MYERIVDLLLSLIGGCDNTICDRCHFAESTDICCYIGSFFIESVGSYDENLDWEVENFTIYDLCL